MATAMRPDQAQFLDDYVGFAVETADGPAGKVTKDTYDTDRDHFVVKPSLFARKVELPGDAIIAIDDGVVRLGMSKAQLRRHPRFVDPRRRRSGGRGPDHVIPL